MHTDTQQGRPENEGMIFILRLVFFALQFMAFYIHRTYADAPQAGGLGG